MADGIAGGDSDRPLIEQAQSELPYGTTAYDQLVRKHSASVYRRCYGILRSASDAEEATQDVFLSVFRNLARFRFERPFAHWLGTVTLNACRMILRSRAREQRRRADFQHEQPESSHPEQAHSDSALRRLMIELLDELDPGTRVSVLMRCVEGYSYAEIAEQLDISESAAKMRVSRGSKRLRALYEERIRATAPDEEPDDGSA